MDVIKIAFAAGLVATSAIAGVAGAPIWMSLLAGLGLSSISISEQRKLRVRFAGVGASDLLTASHVASIANSCLTTGAAWCVGSILRLAVQFIQ